MAKLSTEKRKQLPDSAFGIPEKRMYPLYKLDENDNLVPDKAHIESAVKLFGHASDADKPKLARNILKAAHKADMDTSGWDKVNAWAKKESTKKNESKTVTEWHFHSGNNKLTDEEKIHQIKQKANSKYINEFFDKVFASPKYQELITTKNPRKQVYVQTANGTTYDIELLDLDRIWFQFNSYMYPSYGLQIAYDVNGDYHDTFGIDPETGKVKFQTNDEWEDIHHFMKAFKTYRDAKLVTEQWARHVKVGNDMLIASDDFQTFAEETHLDLNETSFTLERDVPNYYDQMLREKGFENDGVLATPETRRIMNQFLLEYQFDPETSTVDNGFGDRVPVSLVDGTSCVMVYEKNKMG